MTSKLATVRGVVFDAVGTLIHPNPPAAVVYCEVGRQHGSRLTPEDVAQNFGRALKRHAYQPQTNEQIERDRWRQIVANVFSDLSDTQSLFFQLWEHFAQPASWAVYEDVPAAFAELRSLGMTIAIGSNFDDRLLAISRELPPLGETRTIFVSSQLGFTKPSIEFFLAIEAELQLQPHQLLMVGDDATNDIEGSIAAGWHSLLLDRDPTRNAPTTIRSLREIAAFLP